MSDARFHIANFGCRASQSEGAAIEDELRSSGARQTGSALDAEVVIVNSCTVTEEADRDVRRLIRRVARRNPDSRIIVTGCYAQRRPEELAAMPGVQYVVGNSHKSQVPTLARDTLDDIDAGNPNGRAEIFCSDIFEERLLGPTDHQGSSGRTRATVKVQDGCNANCSFCIIPSVRGRSRSLAPASVIAEVRALVDRGYREVVFSGIHLGSYGRDLEPATRFSTLIRTLLEDIPDLERLRLSSIEPLEVTDDVLGLVAGEPRIARHLHVPAQSGSSRILRAMRRPYSGPEYADLAARIRDAVPDAAIGADVMVGFPGETDDEFMETYRLVESSPLTYLHVFPYSARPGTPAAEMDNPVPEHVARFRGQHLRSLIARKNAAFREGFVGRELDVLIYDEADEGGWRAGISDNFIRVEAPASVEVNRWRRVRVVAAGEKGLRVA
jgi:threonylcarbamoyladenosine tRNA methylthiotransferase MtaB